MKLNALLYLDIDYIEDIKKLLLEEEFEVYDLIEKEHLLEEAAKEYLDIIFLSCSCDSCGNSIIPTIKNVKELDPRVEIICVGTRENEAMAIEAIKCGATACIGTPLNQTHLREIILKIKNIANLRKETYQIETTLQEKYIFANMVSKNPIMLDIFSLIRRIAPYYRTLLIVGETGTGKEILARAIHNLSPASKKPFVTCNCSGLVETLIESELFGHVKGAYTGAVSDKKGLFEAAGNGTIFLDEIGAMPLSFQPHLLRVLQDGEFRRVGSTQPLRAKCRVIAATNTDLHEKVKEELFREDLFFRLAVITIELPLLKKRKEDIPMLCYFFINKLNKKLNKEIRGITMAAKHPLMSYEWPGNIRELENALERAILVTTANFIRLQDLPSYIKEGLEKDSPTGLSLEKLEKNHIQSVLITAGGNKTKAASLLDISRRALLRKIYKHGLTQK